MMQKRVTSVGIAIGSVGIGSADLPQGDPIVGRAIVTHLGVGLHRAAQGRLCVGGHGVRLVEDEQLVPSRVRVRVRVRIRVRVRVRVRMRVRVGVRVRGRLWVGVKGEW